MSSIRYEDDYIYEMKDGTQIPKETKDGNGTILRCTSINTNEEMAKADLDHHHSIGELVMIKQIQGHSFWTPVWFVLYTRCWTR